MASFVLILLIFGISTTNIQAQVQCTWGCYLANYVDLQKAFGCDLKRAEDHYIAHGKKEGRDCSCNKCNWQCYLDNYEDLQRAFGSSLQLAENHYNTFGRKEGRDCKCKCNWYCYLDRYQDLKNAFGCNVDAAQTHWNTHGKNEGRNCQCTVPISEPAPLTPNQPPSMLLLGLYHINYCL